MDPIGEGGDSEEAELFDSGTTARVIQFQNLVPGLVTVVAYLHFAFVPTF